MDDGWVDRYIYGSMDGSMVDDGWIDGWMDGWMDDRWMMDG